MCLGPHTRFFRAALFWIRKVRWKVCERERRQRVADIKLLRRVWKWTSWIKAMLTEVIYPGTTWCNYQLNYQWAWVGVASLESLCYLVLIDTVNKRLFCWLTGAIIQIPACSVGGLASVKTFSHVYFNLKLKSKGEKKTSNPVPLLLSPPWLASSRRG